MCNKTVDNSLSATGLELKITGQTGKMIQYLYVRSIWLDVLIMPRTRFRVNLHSIVERMSRNFLRKTDVISEV